MSTAFSNPQLNIIWYNQWLYLYLNHMYLYIRQIVWSKSLIHLHQTFDSWCTWLLAQLAACLPKAHRIPLGCIRSPLALAESGVRLTPQLSQELRNSGTTKTPKPKIHKTSMICLHEWLILWYNLPTCMADFYGKLVGIGIDIPIPWIRHRPH